MKRTVETAVTAFLAMAASTTSVFAAGGTGLDTASLQSWINNYLEPLETVLLWVIPTQSSTSRRHLKVSRSSHSG